MNVWNIARFVGLSADSKMNGKYVEILTPLMEITVPEADDVRRKALRYGIQMIETGETGYAKPENLELVPGDRRSVEIHLFGWTRE